MSAHASIEELQRRDLAALLDLSKALSREPNLDKLLQLITAKVTEVIGADRSTLFLYDEASQELWSKIAEKLGNKEIRIPLGIGIAGAVAQTRIGESISDPYGDPRFNPAFDKRSGYRTYSILCTPMIGSSDNLLGVVQVLNKLGDDAFDHRDESLLEAFAAHAAVALERARTRDELERAHDELQTLYHAKSKMIDHLSHELKTPLSIIAASCKSFQSDATRMNPDRSQRTLHRIERSVQRLLDLEIEARDIAQGREARQGLQTLVQLSGDLLSMLAEEELGEVVSKKLSRRFDEIFQPEEENETQEIRLHQWVPDVLRTIAPLHHHRAVEIRTELGEVPAIQMAESVLRKAFVGLVRNAIEGTEDGGCVWVELEDVSSTICLRVRDFGVGISPEFKKQLFHGFVHAGDTDRYSSRNPYDFMAGGKGLDLLRTKLFAERYRFDLQVDSELGKGSCFSLEFPASTQVSEDTRD